MKKIIYIFVRNDLSYAQKIIQAAHATLETTRKFIKDDARYKIIAIAIKNEGKLKAVIGESASHGIETVAFTEPDLDFQITAVATRPLIDAEKNIFKRYKLLSG